MNVLQRVGLATGIVIVFCVAGLAGCSSAPIRGGKAVILTPTPCDNHSVDCVIHVYVGPDSGTGCLGFVQEDDVRVKQKKTPVVWEIVKIDPKGDPASYEFAGGVGDIRFYRGTPNPPATPYLEFESNPAPTHSRWKTTAKATTGAGLQYVPVVWRGDNVPCTIADPTISNMGG
jgi:hypothetical protein